MENILNVWLYAIMQLFLMIVVLLKSPGFQIIVLKGFLKRRCLEMSALFWCFQWCLERSFKNFLKKRGGGGNGDNLLISMLGRYGHSECFPNIEPVAYRLHGNSTWSSKNAVEKSKMWVIVFIGLGNTMREKEERNLLGFTIKNLLSFWSLGEYSSLREELQ